MLGYFGIISQQIPQVCDKSQDKPVGITAQLLSFKNSPSPVHVRLKSCRFRQIFKTSIYIYMCKQDDSIVIYKTLH